MNIQKVSHAIDVSVLEYKQEGKQQYKEEYATSITEDYLTKMTALGYDITEINKYLNNRKGEK